MDSAALGFRDHSGWVAVVALGGPVSAPLMLARERIALLPAHLPRQPYHAVAEDGTPRSVITQVESSAFEAAVAAIHGLIGSLAESGYAVSAAGVGASASAIPESLDTVLRSHALLHAAEGELYRQLLAAAASECGLAVRRFPWRDVAGIAATELPLAPAMIDLHLAAIGRAAGPPWTRDQKDAALAGWLALASPHPR